MLTYTVYIPLHIIIVIPVTAEGEATATVTKQCGHIDL